MHHIFQIMKTFALNKNIPQFGLVQENPEHTFGTLYNYRNFLGVGNKNRRRLRKFTNCLFL